VASQRRFSGHEVQGAGKDFNRFLLEFWASFKGR
jgi:hypothetical protein